MDNASVSDDSFHSFHEEQLLPLSARDLDQLQYHISLQEIGQKLQHAADAAYPNDNRSRYSNVYALLLSWEDEDPMLPVTIEIEQLREVFETHYHFNTEEWKIPSHGSHNKLSRKILDFIAIEDDSIDILKIVYYGGHGMLSHNRQPAWASRADSRDPAFRTLKWSGIQPSLEEAESDVLIILDCCASGTANSDGGRGVTELIAACGFNVIANPVGPYSFTNALTTELRLMRSTPSFTVGKLYSRVLERTQNWMPTGRELQKPPLHIVLTQDQRLPRSIQLSAKRRDPVGHLFPTNVTTPIPEFPASRKRPSRLDSLQGRLRKSPSTESSSSSPPGLTLDSATPRTTATSTPGTSLSEDEFPKIALTIRLKESLKLSDFSVDLFSEWMQMMPVLAERVKVEAGFSSYSTLFVISIPIELWCYLPSDPAISIVGLITSSNRLLSSNPTKSIPEIHNVNTNTHTIPDRRAMIGKTETGASDLTEKIQAESEALRHTLAIKRRVEQSNGLVERLNHIQDLRNAQQVELKVMQQTNTLLEAQIEERKRYILQAHKFAAENPSGTVLKLRFEDLGQILAVVFGCVVM